VALYDVQTKTDDKPDLESIYGARILFIVTVMKSGLNGARWPVIDSRELEQELSYPTLYFIRDKMSGEYSIYRSSDGHTHPSSYEECKALEAAAVWEPEHVEDRLRDTFAGRQNRWAEQLRARPLAS
jgi:hypothetical protein